MAKGKKQLGGATSKVGGIIAPVKGWTSQKSLAEAEPDTAVVLDNFFPEADAVRARRGATLQGSGLGASVDTIIPYASKTGGSKLFAAAAGNVYDVTAIGPVGAAVLSGKANAKWQYCLFSNAASQFLTMVNGVDGVWTWNGAAWTDQTAAITGTGGLVNSFVQVTSHNKRLWFLPENSTDLWYLAPDAINGPAVKFGVGAQMKLGGKLIAMATWSSSQGNAMDDRLVIISSEGEVFLYAGTDPSSASTWALSLRFVLAPPLSNRCFFEIGADLAILTEAGLLLLSQVIEIDAAALSDKAFSKRIRGAYTDAAKSGRNLFGWCMTTLPNSNMAIINVPSTTDGGVQQFALNTVTGAWGRFTGWDANNFGYLSGAIYYGDMDGNVFRAEYGPSDNGATINCVMVTAFNTLKFPGFLKIVSLVRPIISSDTEQDASIAVAVDYTVPELTAVLGVPSVGDWFVWGVSTWGGPDLWRDEQISLGWNGVGNVGTMIAVAYAVSIDAGGAGNEFDYRIIAFNIVFEVGSVV